MPKLEKARKSISNCVTQPIVNLLARTPLTPNVVTWLGFCITIVAAVLIVTGHLFAAGFVVLVAGLFDMLDGALARVTNRVTRFGGILDSTLDRLSEAILLLGLLAVFAREQQVAESILVGVALLGSLMVSYIRARMEGLGIECKTGLFTRPERVIVLALGLLLSRFDCALVIALAVITFFSYFTAGQRLLYAWRQTRQ
ncbi:MAG TPA: CDP-alcohol phosphatidyltransferase family protein [Dehalococcoidales bacterium]|nr:CDP-alcohol phosphatidyltransferase family protein [Dehalococcoidales bacterium]